MGKIKFRHRIVAGILVCVFTVVNVISSAPVDGDALRRLSVRTSESPGGSNFRSETSEISLQKFPFGKIAPVIIFTVFFLIFPFLKTRFYKSAVNFFPDSVYAQSSKDSISISPGAFKGLYLDTRYGVIPRVPVDDGVDLSGYVLEFTFKKGKRAQIQPWFKNNSWRNVYAYPKWPDRNGVIRFNPAKDARDVDGFKDFSHIYAIGAKVWAGGTAEQVQGMIESVRIFKSGRGVDRAVIASPKGEAIPPLGKETSLPKVFPDEVKKTGLLRSVRNDASVDIPLDSAMWQAQGWVDTQAVRSVYFDDVKQALIGRVNLEQGHPNNDHGEMVVDVMHLGMQPFDFSKVKITADVKVEIDRDKTGREKGSFGGTANRPDGVGIFVKTGAEQGWSNMYDWENFTPDEVGKWKNISFSFAEGRKRDIVYTQAGFPKKNPIIRMFGIKIGAGTGTGSKFKGRLLVRNLRIEPISAADAIPAPTFWPSASAQRRAVGTTQISAAAGWVGRDQKGNRAVQEVFVKDGILALKVKFKGGNPFGDYNKGSAYCLLYDKQGNRIVDIPGLPKRGFVDWSGKVIKADVWAPREFAKDKNIPSAVLVGSHDAEDNYQNGSWQEGLFPLDRTEQWETVKYYPTAPRVNNPGYTTPEYDVSAGKEILIKVGLPGAAKPEYEWEGYIYISNIRIEPDDRSFEDSMPLLIWTEPFARTPVKKSPVPAEVFKRWSGASGYGLFDKDLTPEGLRALKRKFRLISPEAKIWRHMALYGSLAPNGAIAFDGDDTPIGFADPETGRMGSGPFAMLPEVLKRIDGICAAAKQKGLKVVLVFIAHDAADGISSKEGRIEGDHPVLFTSSKKFAKFLRLQRSVLKHIRDNWRDVVIGLELFNEPLNMDTNKVPIPFIQRRIDEFNRLVYEIDPTWYISTGMRDTNSWGYFAHMTLSEYWDGDRVVKNPYYRQVIPQSHWYADKEEDTPLGTNVGKFFMPNYTRGWWKGELDPRTQQEYKAGFGVRKVLDIIYKGGYLGGAFWMDRAGEFWPNWGDFTHFIRNILPKRAPFAAPTKERTRGSRFKKIYSLIPFFLLFNFVSNAHAAEQGVIAAQKTAGVLSALALLSAPEIALISAVAVIVVIIGLRIKQRFRPTHIGKSFVLKHWMLSSTLVLFLSLAYVVPATLDRIYYFSFDTKRLAATGIYPRNVNPNEAFDSQRLIKNMEELQDKQLSSSERRQIMEEIKKDFKWLGQIIVGSESKNRSLPDEAKEMFLYLLNFVKDYKQISLNSVSDRWEINLLRDNAVYILFIILDHPYVDYKMGRSIVDTLAELLEAEEPFNGQDPVYNKYFPYIDSANLLSANLKDGVYQHLSMSAQFADISYSRELALQRIESLEYILGGEKDIDPAKRFFMLLGTPQYIEDNLKEIGEIEKAPVYHLSLNEVKSIRGWKDIPLEIRKFCIDSAIAYRLPPRLLFNQMAGLGKTTNYSIEHGLLLLVRRGRISDDTKDVMLKYLIPDSLHNYFFSSQTMDFLGGVIAGGKNTMGMFQMRPAQVRRYKAWSRFGIDADKLSDNRISRFLLNDKYAIEARAAMLRGMIDEVIKLRKESITNNKLPRDNIDNYKEDTRGLSAIRAVKPMPILTADYYKLLPDPAIFGKEDWIMAIWHPLYFESIGSLDIQKSIIQSGILDNKPAEFVGITTKEDIRKLKSLLRDEDPYISNAAKRTLQRLKDSGKFPSGLGAVPKSNNLETPQSRLLHSAIESSL